MKHDKPIFSQSQEGATLEAYDPTFRERTESVIREFLNKYTGLGRGVSRDTAQFITGTTDPSQGIVESLGVLDFTPAGLLFGGQEAKRDFGKAQDALDYVAPTVGLVFTGAEAFPLTKVITKPLGSFLSNLSKKAGKEVPVDLSRRGAITKIAAAPVAVGALSEVPVGKIIDDFDFLDEVDKVPFEPITKKAVGAVVKNLGQPSKTSVIGKLMDFTDFGKGPQYGTETMKESVENFSSELNKAKKYFELKNKTLDQDELDMISTNNDMADYLENLQTEFGYTNDQIIKFIEDTDSTTRKNTKVWETYLEFGGAEGDPEVGKKLGLGDESENWENWYEDDLFEKFYGSNEADITGKTISKAED